MLPLKLAGQQFGRLTAIESGGVSVHGKILWKCVCSCGREVTTVGTKLVTGHTRSCGCIKADRMRSYRKKKLPRQPCAADGCNRETILASGTYCAKHEARLKRYGRLTLIRRENGTGWMAKRYLQVSVNGRRTYEHIVVAERVLGRRLPSGAVVHHVNLDTHDNRPCNLVICPNEAYHRLLHKRLRDHRAA